MVAVDGTGGAFIAYGPGPIESRPILHATSEGQAGRVGSSLSEFVGILIQLPFWGDLLKFSGGGKLPEMRRVVGYLEADYAEEEPELDVIRERICSELAVPKIIDAIAVLHNSVHATDCTLVSEDGDVYCSLFNSFTVEDNPSWREKTT